MAYPLVSSSFHPPHHHWLLRLNRSFPPLAREKDTQVKPYAEKIASQIIKPLAKGVPPENITIIGASKGGIIAAYTSTMLREEGINYVYLAGLFKKYLVDEDLKLSGNVLSIHDQSDKLGITPLKYFQRSEGFRTFKTITLKLGKGHGIIYKPYREWINPLIKWLKIN